MVITITIMITMALIVIIENKKGNDDFCRTWAADKEQVDGVDQHDNDFGHDDDDDDGDDDDDDDGCEPEGGDMRQVGASLVDQVSLPAANRRNLKNFKTWKTFRF